LNCGGETRLIRSTVINWRPGSNEPSHARRFEWRTLGTRVLVMPTWPYKFFGFWISRNVRFLVLRKHQFCFKWLFPPPIYNHKRELRIRIQILTYIFQKKAGIRIQIPGIRIYNTCCCDLQACSCEGEHMFCRECVRRGCEVQLGENQRRMVCFNQACVPPPDSGPDIRDPLPFFDSGIRDG
jgi:hypothetical protein